jgi:hypothetical protein
MYLLVNGAVKSCWMFHLCRSIVDAKASIALDGMGARPCSDPKIASKDPDCFEVRAQ